MSDAQDSCMGPAEEAAREIEHRRCDGTVNFDLVCLALTNALDRIHEMEGQIEALYRRQVPRSGFGRSVR